MIAQADQYKAIYHQFDDVVQSVIDMAVTVYRFVTKDTIDLVDSLIEDNDQAAKLTTDDLLTLLKTNI